MPNFFAMRCKFVGGRRLSFARARVIMVCMKAFFRPIITAALCLALSLAAGAGISALSGGVSAYAEEDDALFLPGSFEEYLPLSRPTAAAMNDAYIVIADGSTLYIYDRTAGTYSERTHIGSDGTESAVTCLQFTADGRLYFSDQSSQLYAYSFVTDSSVIQTDVPCSSFVIEGSTLYTAAVSGTTTIYALAIPANNAPVSMAQAVRVGEIDDTRTPCMTFSGNTLYCAIDYTVYAYSLSESGYSRTMYFLAGGSTEIFNLTALYAFGGEFYYTVSGTLSSDGLYRADMGNSSELLLAGSGFSSLFSYGDTLYCIQGAAIRALSLSGHAASYTGYEISAGSDNFNRMLDAGETARGGDLVVTADSGNGRVLIYDSAENSYSAIPLNGTPTCVATDGEIIAVGVGAYVYLYRYGEDTPYAEQLTTGGIVVTGVTLVYGVCYYITDHSYGVLAEGIEEAIRSNTPAAITSDIWGNIYVADTTLRVTRYTEEEFSDSAAEGLSVTDTWSLPAGFRSLRADHEGNLYYLYGNALYCNGAQCATVNADSYVYRADRAGADEPVSFALNSQDCTVYFQFGGFVVRRALSIPSLSTIGADGVMEELASSHAPAELTLCSVPEGTTSIRVDLSAMTEDSAYYAYESHLRTAGGEGIVLAQTQDFVLAACYESYGYTIGLYRAEDIAMRTPETAEHTGVRYLSNAASLTAFPCTQQALVTAELARGTQVQLLGTFSPAVGFEYSYISCTRENGTTYGYVLSSYLVEFSPLYIEEDDYRLGYLKASEEGVIFRSGEARISVTDRIQVRIYDMEDGFYLARFVAEDGTVYTAQVTDSMLEAGNTDTLRTSMIVILCVLAVGIVTAWFVLRPPKEKNQLRS